MYLVNEMFHEAKVLGRGEKSIPGSELEQSMEYIYKKFTRAHTVHWEMAPMNSDINNIQKKLLECYLLHDYRERRQVIRNRFRGIYAWGP